MTAEESTSEELVPVSKPGSIRGEIVLATADQGLLDRIRPHWQQKRLIDRVAKLLPVDPSSACQRLLNAAIHDLREKIVIAGIDVAGQVAETTRMPAIKKDDDVLEAYSVRNVIDLSYRMGLLTRPEWRRVRRCYEIRRDLEHEDDEYEATIEDCVYIFKTCIDVVLSRDPVQLLRVEDVKQLVETPEETRLSPDYIEEFRHAPDTRQVEICKYLLSKALDSEEVQVVQANAVEVLKSIDPTMSNHTRLELTKLMVERVGKGPLSDRVVRVSHAAGVLGLLPRKKIENYFRSVLEDWLAVGYGWRKHGSHTKLLDEFADVGGLAVVPDSLLQQFVLWMTLCYLGEPGGYGTYGVGREVFYSNTGARRIERMARKQGERIRSHIEAAADDKRVKAARKCAPIDRRYERLLDLCDESSAR